MTYLFLVELDAGQLAVGVGLTATQLVNAETLLVVPVTQRCVLVAGHSLVLAAHEWPRLAGACAGYKLLQRQQISYVCEFTLLLITFKRQM